MAAVDGDTELNKAIWYELGFYENQDCESKRNSVARIMNTDFAQLLSTDSQHISIDTISGDIAVEPINRDALNQEIFPFYVNIYLDWNCETYSPNNDTEFIADHRLQKLRSIVGHRRRCRSGRGRCQ